MICVSAKFLIHITNFLPKLTELDVCILLWPLKASLEIIILSSILGNLLLSSPLGYIAKELCSLWGIVLPWFFMLLVFLDWYLRML